MERAFMLTEVKVVTSDNESTFQTDFKVAMESVEASGKVKKIKFAPTAIPPKEHTMSSSKLYYTAFILYEIEESSDVEMDKI